MGKVINWFRGRKAKLEKVLNERNVLFPEVIDEHIHSTSPKPKQDDIIDVLLAINKKQVESCNVVITHESIKAILFVRASISKNDSERVTKTTSTGAPSYSKRNHLPFQN